MRTMCQKKTKHSIILLDDERDGLRKATKPKEEKKHLSSVCSVGVRVYRSSRSHRIPFGRPYQYSSRVNEKRSLIGCYAICSSVRSYLCAGLGAHRHIVQNEAADVSLPPIFRREKKTYKYPCQARTMFIFSLAFSTTQAQVHSILVLFFSSLCTQYRRPRRQTGRRRRRHRHIFVKRVSLVFSLLLLFFVSSSLFSVPLLIVIVSVPLDRTENSVCAN